METAKRKWPRVCVFEALSSLLDSILDRVLKIMLLDVQFVKHQATQQDLSRQTPVEPMALSAADHEEYSLLSQFATPRH